MSLPSYYVGCVGDMCRCGRKRSIPHCVSSFCSGSFKVKVVKDPRRKPESARDSLFWVCEKCDYGFLDSDRDNCNAPLYETKVIRAAKELARTRSAVEDGHPLTTREEVITESLPQVVESTLPELDAEELDHTQKEWMHARLRGATLPPIQQYILNKRRRKALLLKYSGENDATSEQNEVQSEDVKTD